MDFALRPSLTFPPAPSFWSPAVRCELVEHPQTARMASLEHVQAGHPFFLRNVSVASSRGRQGYVLGLLVAFFSAVGQGHAANTSKLDRQKLNDEPRAMKPAIYGEEACAERVCQTLVGQGGVIVHCPNRRPSAVSRQGGTYLCSAAHVFGLSEIWIVNGSYAISGDCTHSTARANVMPRSRNCTTGMIRLEARNIRPHTSFRDRIIPLPQRHRAEEPITNICLGRRSATGPAPSKCL